MIDPKKKLYTRKELEAMNGTDFGVLYSSLHAWAQGVLGFIPSNCTTLESVLIIQHKKLVARTVALNKCREMELMDAVNPFFTL